MSKIQLIFVSLLFGLTQILGCSGDEQAEVKDPMASTPGSDQTPATPSAGTVENNMVPSMADDAMNKDTTGKMKSGNMEIAEGIHYVTTGALNVRSGPGVSHPVVSTLPFQHKVSSKQKHGKWIKIGQDQYVYSEYLSTSMPKEPVMNPVIVKGNE
jgi:hypothetical protein